MRRLAPVLIVAVLALTGCSSFGFIDDPPPVAPSQSTTPEATPDAQSSAEGDGPLTASARPGDTVLDQERAMSGGQEIDNLAPTGPRVDVNVRCVGTGELEIKVGVLGQYGVTCGAADAPEHGASFDASRTTSLVVTVTPPDDSVLWAMTVTSGPLDN
jgi:hypothetical protein